MRIFLTLVAALALLTSPAFAKKHMMNSAMPTCAAGDPVVWVNMNTKVYHVQGDKLYGTTKSGKYVCLSAASAMGARASKGHKLGNNMNAEDNGSMKGSATGVKHKRHHGEGAIPGAAATPKM